MKPDDRLRARCLDAGFLRIVFLTGVLTDAFATTGFLTTSRRMLAFLSARGVLIPLVQDGSRILQRTHVRHSALEHGVGSNEALKCATSLCITQNRSTRLARLAV